jgi:glycine/D-amino acid oxidase-like deaminating enzyme
MNIREEPRNIPVVQDCDVCVLGGSCTGVFAAVRAAQMGATVALVEKQNAFGGAATSGLVAAGQSLFFTMKDVHTLNHEPQRAARWVEIAREEISRGAD